jgi:tRNA A-37 threonylcarbamoyl transferase component Bud32
MSERFSLRRLLRLGRDAAPEPAPALAAPEPVVLGSREDGWLGGLATATGEGQRLGEIGGEEFLAHIDALRAGGHDRAAALWLQKFVVHPLTPEPVRVALRVRLVELGEERGELAEHLDHLEALLATEAHATRAHFLLAEHHRRRGDEAPALRHYEAVLARDLDYPNVRARIERLRAARGRALPAAAGATLAAVELGGTTTGSRYHLVRELGRGATGVVYLARDGELERDVAVKLLHPHLSAAAQAEACARFFGEARLAASLRHPNIVAILDLDEDARRIVMELGGGGTLREALRGRGPSAPVVALERHAQILSALLTAHRRGIVHRDVKPANLMFRRDPDAAGVEIVLGDFGVAHLPGPAEAPRDDAEKVRRQRDAVGTLAYMAPELRKGGVATPRSDLYAAAVVLYEMLTGRYPWPPHALLAGIRRHGDFKLPEGLRGALEPGLARALQEHLDALSDPEAANRPESGAALDLALELRDAAIVTSGGAAVAGGR